MEPRFPAMNRFSAMLAKLHTAVSLSSEYSMISEHRLDDRMTPRFFWFVFLLTASCSLPF